MPKQLVQRGRLDAFSTRLIRFDRDIARGFVYAGTIESQEEVINGFYSLSDRLSRVFGGSNLGKLIIKQDFVLASGDQQDVRSCSFSRVRQKLGERLKVQARVNLGQSFQVLREPTDVVRSHEVGE